MSVTMAYADRIARASQRAPSFMKGAAMMAMPAMNRACSLSLRPFMDICSENAGRFDNQDRDQDEKGVDVLVLGGQIAGPQGLDNAENEPARHGAGYVADAPQNGSGEGLHPRQVADRIVDDAVMHADGGAGAGGEE